MPTKLYKQLTSAEITKIIHDLYGSDAVVKECRPLEGGNFNTNYFIKTNQDNNGLVLRAAPVPKDKQFLFSFHKDMMSGETLFYKMMEEKGIPTAKVLKYAPENTFLNREYMITEYIPSVTMNDHNLNQNDLSLLYTETGKYIRKLHTITSSKFGWIRPYTTRGEFDTWRQFVFAYMNEVADKCEEFNLFENEQIRYLRDLFKHKSGLFDGAVTPNMIHKDLHEGNILIRQKNGKYEVAAIIDTGWVIFGDRKWELLSRCMINKSFLNGYGEDVPQDAAFKEMSQLYKLLHGFFSAYVVKVEYGFDDWYEEEKRNVIALINEIKSNISGLK